MNRKVTLNSEITKKAADADFKNTQVETKNDDNAVAIIGVACRFPKADNPEQYWYNLSHGIDCVTKISAERWNPREYKSYDGKKPLCEWCGQISGFKKFDNRFFNISPREAISMDPQQRMLLEETWHCIEDAGTALPELQNNKTAVVVGAMAVDYLQVNGEAEADSFTCLGSYECILANRLSYFFGFDGPSYTVNAACASSLVALHEAKQMLLNDDCRFAIAAGVNLNIHPLKYLSFSKANMLSADGRCRTFDKDADGYVPGDGIGVLLLQRLRDALRSGSHIYGVIKGSAVSHTGRTKSLTAPSVKSQRNVIIQAYNDAGLSPEQTTYVEAHGTGTSLGDPIEVEALTQAFRQYTDRKQFCSIGSVKSNIGHLEAAAGIAGVIKILLMMKHRYIPQSLHIKEPNPIINFGDSPFKICTEPTSWKPINRGELLRAGISSFGFGGTNSHMIIEEYPEKKAGVRNRSGKYIFMLSAKTKPALKKMVENWSTYALACDEDKLNVKNTCLTLAERESFEFRTGCVVETWEEIKEFIKSAENTNLSPITDDKYTLFIGNLLLNGFPRHIDELNKKILREKTDMLLNALIDVTGSKTLRKEFYRTAWREENQSAFSYILGYSFISTLKSCGFSPAKVSGRGTGLLIAMSVCGMLFPEDAFKIIFDKATVTKISLHRPNLPFYDTVSQKTIMPVEFDSGYLRSLFDCKISGDEFDFYIKKARLLIKNQFTFKKNINEWNKNLNKYGYDVESLIFDDRLTASEGESHRKEKLIITAIIVSGLLQLEKKWDLRSKIAVRDNAFCDLVFLITRSVLPMQMFVDLAVADESDFDSAARIIKDRQEKYGDTADYKYYSQYIKAAGQIFDSDLLSRILSWENTDDMHSPVIKFFKDSADDKDGFCLDFSAAQEASVKQLLLFLWLGGIKLKWSELCADESYKKYSLPVYPFSKDNEFWPENKKTFVGSSSAGFERLSINPLLQMNISDLSEQKFTSVFSGNEFFLSNHMIEGNKILPGVAYLEMVREAACQSSGLIAGENTVIIKNVVFIRPAIVKNNKLQVNVRVKPHDVDELTFEVYSSENSENEIIYCRGAVSFDRTESCADFDIMSFEKECSQRTITDVECYKNFAKSGFDYGCEFRGIKKALLGEQKIISEIELPNSTAQTDKGFYLHPAVMDCALQTALVLMENETGCAAGLPFTVSKVKVIGPTSSKMWAVARPADSMAEKIHSYDIGLLDGAGRLCVRFSGVSFKTEENKFNSMSILQVGESILLFDKTFKQCDICITQKHINYSERIIIFCGINEETAHEIKSMAGVSACVCFNPKTYGAAEFFEKLSLLVFENIKRAILKRHEGKILFQVLIEDSPQNMVVQGLDGLFKTARLECQRLAYQLITVGSSDCTGASKLLARNVDEPSGNIKYADGKRYAACWEELVSTASPVKKAFKNGGVYLITGGAGGLGYILADEIADSTENTHIILTGRSPCDDEIAGKIELLKNKGADVSYIQSNVTDKNDVCLLADTILKNNKRVNGIIHCAGLIRDNYIINKSADDMRAVMEPKLFGSCYIDEAFKDQPLDFFILFSSFSGCMGNPGQADYAAASSFMDAFSQYRNTLVKSGERNGRTLAVDWPLCRDGGMHVDSNTEKLMLQRLGMLPMKTDSFISAFYKALECDRSSVMIINGDAKTIRQKIICDFPAVENNADWKERKEGKRISARDKVLAALISNVSEIIKVSPQEICEESELSEYGFESITYTELAGKLNDEFNLELNPTVFFEYPTIKSIAEFILPSCPVEEAESATTSGTITEENTDKVLPDINCYRNIECDTAANAEEKKNGGQPVAVIGMSGRFPMADNLDEFWDNLLDGKDCISEVPQSRWDWREYFGDPKNGGDKTNIKWGGFINGIDEFDPMFFGITPGEAEIMDPAQRLLMTYVWEALEDAGISPQTLSGSNTGIFTGIINSGYERLIDKADKDSGSFLSTGMLPSIGPNRISFFLNINGPSEPVDTACSSSLVAIHRAVMSIRAGTCDAAIAGGVNVMVTPDFHIKFNKAGMLCEDGHCKTFSDNADGYVRGEGVGIIILKRKRDAERDGDNIYGVIVSSAENHGGRAGSLTSPNPAAQAALLETAYKNAGIDPTTVTYIETHGTGTKLGDPIEINALKEAFKNLYHNWGCDAAEGAHCGLGSVKTNIGHLEYASGIAGVIKVLLQMKHKTLVKTLNFRNLNPYINFEGSPFYIVNENREWTAIKNKSGEDLPRRAGVSSFGIGGVNAHIVLEEYIPAGGMRENCGIESFDKNSPAIIVLSAKNRSQLKEKALQLLTFIQSSRLGNMDLNKIAFTTQTGRDAMDERLAFAADSIETLKNRLTAFVEKGADADGVFTGNKKDGARIIRLFNYDDGLLEVINKWLRQNQYEKFLELWVNGLNIDWNKLYGDKKPEKMRLPVYPFAKENYWVKTSEKTVLEEPSRDSGSVSKYYSILDEMLGNSASIEDTAKKLEML